MKKLVYYTLGYSNKYLEITKLSIQSLLHYNKDIDIIVLIDEQYYNEANILYKNLTDRITIISTENSKSPPEASMRKLQIFKYNIQSYDVVLYIDSDILIDCCLDEYFNKINNTDKLCVGTESTDLNLHTHMYWSLSNYTEFNLNYFRENNIHIFNAGLFGFKPTNIMKTHFTAVQGIIKSHTGPYFYEQSFMNYYFNLINFTDRNIFTKSNYILMPKNHTEYKNSIIHFTGEDNGGNYKLFCMKKYITMYMSYLL